MKILVTGASGFIGKRLSCRLLDLGHELVTLTRGKTAGPAVKAHHFSGDVTDKEIVSQAVKDCDLVFHLAGLVSYRAADTKRQYDINVLGTRNVMEAARAASVKRVVYTGSIAGMGIPPKGQIGDESMKYNLAGRGLNYCDSKHEGEKVALEYNGNGFEVIALCPGIIFGEGDTHPHHRAIFLAMSKGWLVGWPRGGVTFCDIEDVVTAHINAMTMGIPGQRYVLGSANMTYRQAAIALAAEFGCKTPAFELPPLLLYTLAVASEFVLPLLGRAPSLTRQVAWLAQQEIFFSWQKSKDELCCPETPFTQTVRRTAPYYLGLSFEV